MGEELEWDTTRPCAGFVDKLAALGFGPSTRMNLLFNIFLSFRTIAVCQL